MVPSSDHTRSSTPAEAPACALPRVSETSITLLERLRQPNAQEAWRRFVDLYSPLLYYWARRAGLGPTEAADLVQDVLVVLVQKLPTFRYDPRKSFRAWLRTVTLNRWHQNGRRPALPTGDEGLSGVAVTSSIDLFEETEYRRHLVHRALEVMQSDFKPSTWKACWEVVVAGRPAAEVARELGLSVDAVYMARSRVLRRLREELAGLLD